MIYFIIGGTYTCAIIVVGFWFGYSVGQRSETNVLHEMRQSIKRKKDTTGPIRPTPKVEREKIKSLQDFVDDL